MKTMKLTGIRQMVMTEVPDPIIVNPSDVKVRMKVVGVCGSDIHYYISGKIGDQVVSYPFAVGHEGAGEVVDVGSDVTLVKPGDRVAIEPAMPCHSCDQCMVGRLHTCRNLRFLGCPGQAEGCLSEYIIMPESSCFTIPDNMSLDEAALSEPLAIGLYAVNQSIPLEDTSIGILGFGPIGMSVMLCALNRDASRVFVTDKITERISMAVEAGADWAGNPDKEDIVEAILDMAPRGLDVVFECCGEQEAVDQAIDLLKPGGTLMIVGIPQFDQWAFDVGKLRRKEIIIKNVRRQNHTLEETLSLISNGLIPVKSMATHRFPFNKSKDAFDLVAGYKDGVMKAMIDM